MILFGDGSLVEFLKWGWPNTYEEYKMRLEEYYPKENQDK